MNKPVQIPLQDVQAVFPEETRQAFAAAYPETSLRLNHTLMSHPLLTLDCLADLAERLGQANVEYNLADLPIAIAPEAVQSNGLGIAETVRTIAANKSWAVLKHIEHDPAYRALLHDLLEELRPYIEAKTGPMLTLEGFIFISSPGAVTPFHFDPEHNILLQITGDKLFTIFPAGVEDIAASPEHERYHAGGSRNLPWPADQWGKPPQGNPVAMEPGHAIYVPVMAPHWVQAGSQPSISLSITWRSVWSYREGEARMTNRLLRKLGLNPAPPPRWPGYPRSKSIAWRVLRRVPGLVRWVG
jgi:Cupin-like domain